MLSRESTYKKLNGCAVASQYKFSNSSNSIDKSSASNRTNNVMGVGLAVVAGVRHVRVLAGW